MLVISTNFFIGVFVGLYASVAFAIPTPAVTSNTTALLDPRAPLDHGCGQMTWVRRECATNRTPRSWDDVCENMLEIRVPGTTCPVGTVCQNVYMADPENDLQVIETVRCVALPKPNTSQRREGEKDPQVGSSSIDAAATQLGTSTMYYNFGIQDDFMASVSAFFLSADETHVVRPVNIIVGKIRGKGTEVCKGDSSSFVRAMECYPQGRHQLWFGDTIDFSFGLNSGQSGSLKYTVWPS